jgi:uncharacterized surface protein with fasciclin (FAS1) repeats
MLKILIAATTLLAAPADTDIIETAREAGNFTTLLTALEVAGLTETIATGGPFTVFAPTDEAFAKIPAEKLQEILADKELLTAILTYHVVAGIVPSSDVVNLSEAETVNGAKVNIKVWDGSVMLNDAKVIATDIQATNGIIHVIDTVILPPM